MSTVPEGRGADRAAELVPALKEIVGERGWVTDPATLEPHLTEWRGRVRGATPVLLLPASTEEVAAIVRTCARAGVGIVPQGGNTGMCAGAVPDASSRQVIVNLARMDRIRSTDAEDYSIVVEAGCVLARVQRAAADAGRYFPLSLSAEGSCQIGGNIATNAGGINVLRYGMARDQVLGLEAVMPDGTILGQLKTLRKNNAGYDLKHLLIGSEGTLGIITAAALKLYPDPGPLQTAWLALNAPGDAVRALSALQDRFPDRLQAFELISAQVVDMVRRRIPDVRAPLQGHCAWHVLLDAAVAADELESALERLHTNGTVADAIVAKNDGEQKAFWRLRHSIPEAERREGVGVKHDVSVPVGAIAAFLAEAQRRLAAQAPAAIPVVFGHVGDGNLHYNMHLPPGIPETDSARLATDVTRVIYELVSAMGGSISAEHGIGVLKKEALLKYGDPVALDHMRVLKRALDPAGIMNPGKVI